MSEYIILLFLFAIVLVCIIITMIISSGCRYCFKSWIEQTNNEYIVSSNTKNELRRNEDTKQ